MNPVTRRDFLRTSILAAAGGAGMLSYQSAAFVPGAKEITPGNRPSQDKTVEVLHPRARVPLGFIIDDSTCLVNMGKFCMPQFAAAWPGSSTYSKPWKDWPSEIPDAFSEVRVGWTNYQSSPPGFTAWVDDIALDNDRIGCSN